jgi:hypothetical protein
MNAKMFFALALSTPLFVSPAEAIVYTVRTDSGPVTYSLEVPHGTPVRDKIKPNPQVGYSANFPITARLGRSRCGPLGGRIERQG